MKKVKNRVLLSFLSGSLALLVAQGMLHAQQPGKFPPPAKTPSFPLPPPKAPTPQLPPAPSDFLYTADTNELAKKQGLVRVGNFSWGCQGLRCVAKSASPTPDIAGCRALTEQVGYIRSYGHPGRQLTAHELEQCNAGIATGAARGLTPPLIRPPIASGPRPASPGPRFPKQITTGELAMTGLRFQSKEVTTGELAMTGLRFQSKEVTTGELGMTGLRIQPKSVTTGELSMTGLR